MYSVVKRTPSDLRPAECLRPARIWAFLRAEVDIGAGFGMRDGGSGEGDHDDQDPEFEDSREPGDSPSGRKSRSDSADNGPGAPGNEGVGLGAEKDDGDQDAAPAMRKERGLSLLMANAHPLVESGRERCRCGVPGSAIQAHSRPGTAGRSRWIPYPCPDARLLISKGHPPQEIQDEMKAEESASAPGGEVER